MSVPDYARNSPWALNYISKCLFKNCCWTIHQY